MKSKIAVCLDGVIRDLYDNFILIHKDYMAEEDLSVETFDVIDEDTVILNENKKSKRKKLNLDEKIDSMGLTKICEFENIEQFFNFKQNNFPFELYANCQKTYQSAMNDFNKLCSLFNKNNVVVDLLLFEQDNAKFASLMFLSREQFKGNNIVFVQDYDSLKQYDVIITSDLYILKKYKKKSLKVLTKYNSQIKSDYNYNSLKEILNYYEELFENTGE